MPRQRDTYVVVTVDTCNLIKGESVSENMVTFSDNRGDKSGGLKFESKVNAGKSIIWIGIAKDSSECPTIVDIIKIDRKPDGGAQILNNPPYLESPSNPGVVVGKIRSNHVKGIEYYYIKIRVNNIEYTIDPQMRMT